MAFMQWFKCYADLKDHPKRWRFEELADTEYGLHYITAWFSYVCKFAPSGDVTNFSPKEVARACEWKGEAQKLWDALLGAGFIDKVENGFVAHDWHEENGRFIRENEKRKEPKGYPRVTQGLPTRQDKTGQDIKPLAADAADTASKGFNYFGHAVQTLREAGAVITERTGITVGRLNQKGVKVGEAVFRRVADSYCKDKFCLDAGLSLNGLINSFDRLATKAKGAEQADDIQTRRVVAEFKKQMGG